MLSSACYFMELTSNIPYLFCSISIQFPANTNGSRRRGFCSLLCSSLELSTRRSPIFITNCCHICQTLKTVVLSPGLAHPRTIYLALYKCTLYFYYYSSLRLRSDSWPIIGCVICYVMLQKHKRRQQCRTLSPFASVVQTSFLYSSAHL